jgi:hypothetical protein
MALQSLLIAETRNSLMEVQALVSRLRNHLSLYLACFAEGGQGGSRIRVHAYRPTTYRMSNFTEAYFSMETPDYMESIMLMWSEYSKYYRQSIILVGKKGQYGKSE